VAEAADVNLNDNTCGRGPRRRSAIAFQTEARQGRAHTSGYMYPDNGRAVVNPWDGRSYRGATGA
jgi:hypothetical protein